MLDKARPRAAVNGKNHAPACLRAPRCCTTSIPTRHEPLETYASLVPQDGLLCVGRCFVSLRHAQPDGRCAVPEQQAEHRLHRGWWPRRSSGGGIEERKL